MTRLHFRASGLFLGLLITGCTIPGTAWVPREVPAQFENSAAVSGPWPAQDWYRSFASEELNTFVDLAIKGNGDLQGARARVAQADARARQAGAAILPSADATGNANFLAGHSSHGGGHELDWSALLSASYEVDFWGKNRATADSARFLASASRAQRDTVALTTLAGVADSYFGVLALQERVTVARSNNDAARQLLEIVQARFDAGAATPVELATQKAAFDTAQIAIPELEQARKQGLAGLALLLGLPPENFKVASATLDSLVEPVVAAGLPSELLARRPDIYQAEANLRAGHADLKAARAAMFPSLSLTAAAGVQNPALPATVLTIPGAGPSFAVGANLLQPIFNHGRLQAQRDEAGAKQEELLAAYRTSIISALIDVENTLSVIGKLNSVRELQVDNVAQSERAFKGAKLRYQAGSGDLLSLLGAQRTLYAAQDQFIQYKLARFQALISLCKALGGGWSRQEQESI